MKWLRLPVTGLLLLVVAAPALPASLESARRLYREHHFQRAKRELGELIVSSAAAARRPGPGGRPRGSLRRGARDDR
ncbi:MAG: hypothetical protein V3R89_03920 [Thermoanaerobaculia bacterium]